MSHVYARARAIQIKPPAAGTYVRWSSLEPASISTPARWLAAWISVSFQRLPSSQVANNGGSLPADRLERRPPWLWRWPS